MYFLSLGFVSYSEERQVFVFKYLLYCQILDKTTQINKNQPSKQTNNNHSKNKVDPWLVIIKSVSKRKAWIFFAIPRFDNHPSKVPRLELERGADILECSPISRVSKILCQLSGR